MKQKLYVYVDETGQDTLGDLFIVSVVITEGDREALEEQLREIEIHSGKGRRKWMKTRPQQRAAFMREVLKLPMLKGVLG
jgi:hypothetical protein